MFCPNCRRELSDDTKFCGGCGTRILASVQQPEQWSVPQTVQYAQPAQNDQPVQYTDVVFSQPVAPEAKSRKSKGEKIQVLENLKEAVKKIPSKYLKIGGIVAAALVVVIVLVCVFAGISGNAGGNGSGQPDGALYLKDGELYYSDFSKKAPYEVTGRLMDDASNATLRSYAYDIAYSIHVTEDGETMFFMDKLSSDHTGTLYYRSLTNFNKEAEKIAAGVSRYTVSKNGKLVIYLKNGTLYQYDMKEETKLAKEVSGYRVSDDCKTIYYRNTDDAWYVLKNGESEKIGSDITIEHITEDYSTVYYINGDKLYKKTIGKDKEKLVSDVEEITNIQDDGTFYFAKTEEMPLGDFFVEDTDEYDGLMEMLAGEMLEFCEIGYFDGKNASTIGENCADVGEMGNVLYYMQYDASSVNSISLSELVEYYYSSEYYYVVDAAQEMIENQLADSAVTYIAVNGTASVLDLENIYSVPSVGDDGKTVFVLCDVEEGVGTLYKATISGDAVKTLEVYDEDVCISGCGYISADHFAYFKDVKDEVGDLYVNGELVDSDVGARYSISYNHAKKELVYYADYDNEKHVGTLKTWDGNEIVEVYDDVYSYSILNSGDILVRYDDSEYACTVAVWNGSSLTEISDDAYSCTELDNGDLLVATDYSSKNYSYTLSLWNGKKLTEISEDVYSISVMPNGDLLYLYDYSVNKYEGELYHWNGRKAELVDEDVVALITLPGTVTHYFD